MIIWELFGSVVTFNYQSSIVKVTKLINGKTSVLMRNKEEMDIAAQAMAFEQAAYLR